MLRSSSEACGWLAPAIRWTLDLQARTPKLQWPSDRFIRNPEAVEELTAQARSRADEAAEQLEAFLPALQELKLQQAHPYQVAATELAQEMAEVLGRFRAMAA